MGGWATWSEANRGLSLALLFITTAVLGAGLVKLDTHVDLLDILPEGDPNTEAARALQDSFGSAYTQHVTLDLRAHAPLCEAESARLLEARATPMNCGNATDEVYVRAMDEIQEYFLAHPDSPFEYVVGANSFYRLLNWTAEGGADAPESAFALPGRDPAGSLRFRALQDTAQQTIPEAILTPMGHDGVSYVMILIPPEGEADLQAVGNGAIKVLEDYIASVEAGESTWRVFGAENPPTYYTELAIADAHSAQLLREDLQWLLPALALFLVAVLFVGFRSWSAVALSAAAILVSGVWVFGAMGWLGVPLNTFNLAIAPILLGVGIDMGIHFLTAVQAARQNPVREAGQEAGVAMLLATATTVLGLVVLGLSPSPLIAQMGLVAALAIAAVLVVTMTLLPACVTPAMGQRFRPLRWMPKLGRSVQSNKIWVGGAAVVMVAGAVGAFWMSPEPFGEFALNYPEGDPYREQHIDNLQTYYNTAPGEPLFIGNVLVVQGDMLDPAVHDYIERIAAELERAEFVNTQAMTHLPYLVEQYDAVRDGIPGAALVIGQDTLLPFLGLEREKADSREEIKEVLDEAFASPMAHFAALFVDPGYQISLITFSTQTGDFGHVEQSWDSVWAAVERAGEGPADVAFVGNTATNYLFVEKELPFVLYLGVASFVGVLVLVGLALRSVRSAALVGLVVGGSTVTLLGILTWIGIGMSIYLVIPLVFISAIGSDYVVHALLALKRRDLNQVYATVGKAIFFGAITDAGAFAVFAFARDLPTRTTLLAATLAVTITFAFAAILIAATAKRVEVSDSA